MIQDTTIGFAMCGSFCTLQSVIPQIEALRQMGARIVPIVSDAVYTTDTRFGACLDVLQKIEDASGSPIIHTIKDAEPIGPKKLCDILVVVPATGNTLAKLANGIADTPVTMAVKSHLRNGRPVVIGVSSNDALGAGAKNIGTLLAQKHYYFVPMKQDDPYKKPRSVICDLNLLSQTIEYAIQDLQIQPILE